MACCNNNSCAVCSGPESSKWTHDDHADFASVNALRKALKRGEARLEQLRQMLGQLKNEKQEIERKIESIEYDIAYVLGKE